MDNRELWNGPAGRAWVAVQEPVDRMFQPFVELLLDGLAGRVLDVGCGTGATTLAAARRGLDAVGVDISAPMIERARERAAAEGSPARFVVADAASHDFGEQRFDTIISRFGVMFFAEPVHAFTRLRRVASGLRAIAWRGPEENPFMTAAERAAAPHLPGLPPRDPDAPGQFAFADGARVAKLLAASGWTDVRVEPVDVTCTLAERDLVDYFTRLGPVGRQLAEVEEPRRTHIVQAVRAAFDPFVHGDEVRYTAACWSIGAG